MVNNAVFKHFLCSSCTEMLPFRVKLALGGYTKIPPPCYN